MSTELYGEEGVRMTVPYTTPDTTTSPPWSEKQWAVEWGALCALAGQDVEASVDQVMGGLIQSGHAHWARRHLARARKAVA